MLNQVKLKTMLTLKILILISRPTDIATKGQMKRDFDKWFPVPQGLVKSFKIGR